MQKIFESLSATPPFNVRLSELLQSLEIIFGLLRGGGYIYFLNFHEICVRSPMQLVSWNCFLLFFYRSFLLYYRFLYEMLLFFLTSADPV